MRWFWLTAALAGCYFETPTTRITLDGAASPVDPAEAGDDLPPDPEEEGGGPSVDPQNDGGVVVLPDGALAPALDGGGPSARMDAGEAGSGEAGFPSDTGADTGPICACDGGKCLPGTAQCVECLADGDCTNPMRAKCDTIAHSCVPCDAKAQCGTRFAGRTVCAAGACVQCSAADPAACTGTATPVCATTGNMCVGCNANADCKTPGASRCAANACTTCQADADCSHVAGRNVCLAGSCVQCTKDKATACSSGGTPYVCDPSTRACDMNRRARSKTLCNVCTSSTDTACAARRDCISDNECQTGQACVTVPAGGSRRVCQLIKTAAACPRPYMGVTSTPVASADGPSVNVCTFREATTCQAHADVSNKPCGVPNPSMPGGQAPDNARCGEVGVADGICVYSSGYSEYRCTVPCRNDDNDCPAGAAICDRTMTNNFCSL